VSGRVLPTSPVAWLALAATLLGALLSFAVAVVAWRRETETPRVRGYGRYVFTGGVWAAVYAALLLSPRGPLSFGLDVLRAAAAVSTVWLFLLFVVNYTGHRERLAGPLRVAAVVDVVGYVALYATQPVHGLVFERNEPVGVDGLTVLAQEPKALFAAHFFVVIGAALAGIVLLARFAFAARNVFREQTVAVLAGALFTIVGGTVVSFNLGSAGNWQYFDPTPIAFAANGLIVGWALLELEFLTVGPLAANTLVSEMGDAVFVLDDGDRVVDANPTAAGLVDGDAVGASLSSLLPGVASAMGGETPVELPVPVGAADGDGSRFYDVQVTPLRGPYDVRRGSLVVLRDVTGRVRRERELERRNEQLDEFASLVSHDLRNPIGVAQGYVDLAIDSGDVEHLDEVVVSLERMDELVDDLLALARSDRASLDVEPVAVDGCAEAAWRTAETDDAVLDADAGLVVSADRSRLQQLFENLFRNSVEHGSASDRTGSGGGVDHGAGGERSVGGPSAGSRRGDGGAPLSEASLSVTVGALADGDGFFVADDGRGIPDGDRDAVFDYGYSTTDDGTGYGLAIVRSVADAHGWTVTVGESEAGGARFEFRGVELAD